MKNGILLILSIFGLFCWTSTYGQSPDSTSFNKGKHISKGDALISGGLTLLAATPADPGFKFTAIKISGGYYILNRLSLRTGIFGRHFDVIQTKVTTIESLKQVNLVQVSGQIRYDIYEAPGFGSFFLQSGYGYGKLSDSNKEVNSWEILSLGGTLNFFESVASRIGLETQVGFEKNNLTETLLFSGQIGINYFIRCKSCKTYRPKIFHKTKY